MQRFSAKHQLLPFPSSPSSPSTSAHNRFSESFPRLPTHPSTPPSVALILGILGLEPQLILFWGSWDPLSTQSAHAWVVSETPTRGGASFSYAPSAFHAEALAVLHALLWACDSSCSTVRILTDCLALVQVLRNPSSSPISSLWVIRDILRLGRSLQWCLVLKVDRTRVHLAHPRATTCRLQSSSGVSTCRRLST